MRKFTLGELACATNWVFLRKETLLETSFIPNNIVISTETNGVSEAEKSQLKNNVRKVNLVRRLRATTFAAKAGST
ncbi:MAG: hypothetical protein ACLSU0_01300 [Oscillospiraceae bacterium]